MDLSLFGTYPYAFMLGAYLHGAQPSWWQMFSAANPELASLPLEQASEYAFLGFCEQEVDLGKLDRLVAAFVATQGFLLLELSNTVVWYKRFT